MFNPDPVAFTVFGFAVRWYGVIIAFSVVVAVLLAMRECKRVGINPDYILDLAIFTLPAGIIGARILYVTFEWDAFAGMYDTFSWPAFWDVLGRIVDIRSGGLAIFGAVAAGLIVFLCYGRYRKISMWKLIDVMIPSLAIAQSIGRWGNFFNQEAYGYAVNNPALQWFPMSVYIQANGAWHLAIFFYESLWCFLAFLLLYWYQRKSKKDGNVFVMYFLLYGFERMFVEGLREDAVLMWGSFRVSQVIAALMFVGAGVYFIVQMVKGRKRKKTVMDASGVSAELKIIPDDGRGERDANDLFGQDLWGGDDSIVTSTAKTDAEQPAPERPAPQDAEARPAPGQQRGIGRSIRRFFLMFRPPEERARVIAEEEGRPLPEAGREGNAPETTAQPEAPQADDAEDYRVDMQDVPAPAVQTAKDADKSVEKGE